MHTSRGSNMRRSVVVGEVSCGDTWSREAGQLTCDRTINLIIIIRTHQLDCHDTRLQDVVLICSLIEEMIP